MGHKCTLCFRLLHILSSSQSACSWSSCPRRDSGRVLGRLGFGSGGDQGGGWKGGAGAFAWTLIIRWMDFGYLILWMAFDNLICWRGLYFDFMCLNAPWLFVFGWASIVFWESKILIKSANDSLWDTIFRSWAPRRMGKGEDPNTIQTPILGIYHALAKGQRITVYQYGRVCELIV